MQKTFDLNVPLWYTFHQEICRQNIQQKDYKMALIATGVLKLAEYAERKKLKAKGEVNNTAKLEKIRHARKKAAKVARVEVASVFIPVAIGGAVVAVALTPAIGLGLFIKETIDDIKHKKQEKTLVAAQKAKAKADEEEKFKAQLAENAAKRAAKKQVDAETGVFVDLIKESSEILYRKPGKKDIGAFHAGLLNHANTDQENIIQIDDDHIAFVYDFGNGKDKELNVFFINHETGNMEQISQIKSRAGIETIELALANRQLQIAEKARLMAKRRNVNVGLKGKLANNDLHK